MTSCPQHTQSLWSIMEQQGATIPRGPLNYWEIKKKEEFGFSTKHGNFWFNGIEKKQEGFHADQFRRLHFSLKAAGDSPVLRAFLFSQADPSLEHISQYCSVKYQFQVGRMRYTPLETTLALPPAKTAWVKRLCLMEVVATCYSARSGLEGMKRGKGKAARKSEYGRGWRFWGRIELKVL